MLANFTDRFLTRRKTGSDSVPPDCGNLPAISSESVVKKADRWFEPVSYTHLTLPTTPYV